MSKQVNCTVQGCKNFGRYCRSHIMFNPVTPSKVNPVSDKKKDQDKEYKKIRKQYLSAHPFCEAKIEGCGKVSTEIHHKAGRIGENYLNADLFLAVCSSCHRHIEKNPAWARQNNFSISRHSKKTA